MAEIFTQSRKNEGDKERNQTPIGCYGRYSRIREHFIMKRIIYFFSRFKTMTFIGLFSRITTIFLRYGMSPRRFGNAVIPMVALCKKYGVTPSFPVTASAVHRNPGFFRNLQGMGADLAIHGLLHLDYTQLDIHSVENHYARAKEIFENAQIKYNGYRFPYLRRNPERVNLLENAGFEWESSEVISWPGIHKAEVSNLQWDAYQKILQTYQALPVEETVSLPYFRNNIVEIPVSIPDDDILIERVKFPSDLISYIWQSMLQRTAELHEMLVLQLHPERFREFEDPLNQILLSLSDFPEGWKASLDDIHTWWKMRETAHVEVVKTHSDTWNVHAKLPDSGSVVVRNLQPHKYTKKLDDKSGFVNTNSFQIQSEKMPVIGLHPDCPKWMADHLKNDGYPLQVTTDANTCACFASPDSARNHRELSDFVQKCEYPLVQVWRWPDMKSWCFCVSGDIDGITLMDFWDRTHGRI